MAKTKWEIVGDVLKIYGYDEDGELLSSHNFILSDIYHIGYCKNFFYINGFEIFIGYMSLKKKNELFKRFNLATKNEIKGNE